MVLDLIETHRLRLRRFRPDDWRAIHAYTANPAVMAFIPEGRQTEEQARAFVAEHAGDDPRVYALTLRTDDRPIGHLPFHPWFAPRTFEIGWVLNPRHHGQGYATEAAAALLRYGFETLSLHRIIATCQPENPASVRVMEKLGMRREGWFRQCIPRDDGSWWDEYFYAMLRDDWLGRSAGVDDRP